MIYISGEHGESRDRRTVGAGRERCTVLGAYIIEHGATVRQTAQRFGISKSTVHKDVTEVLRQVAPAMYSEVREILEINKQERHLRGGEATRRKYSHKKNGTTEPTGTDLPPKG